MDAVAAVEDRVRDGVRARGIDPLRDPNAVRELVDAAVLELLADGPVTDAASVGTSVLHAVAGFGPLQQFFDDPTVEEVWINSRLTCGWVAFDSGEA